MYIKLTRPTKDACYFGSSRLFIFTRVVVTPFVTDDFGRGVAIVTLLESCDRGAWERGTVGSSCFPEVFDNRLFVATNPSWESAVVGFHWSFIMPSIVKRC